MLMGSMIVAEQEIMVKKSVLEGSWE